MMVDLISDTITLPSQEMLQTILTAQLGDAGRLDSNGRGEDATTNRLEDMAAELTGKEAALFCPTGTLANTCAVLTWCRAGSAILVEERQHLLVSEQICFQEDGFRMCPILYHIDESGDPDIAGIERIIDTEDIQLLCIENTHNFSGGKCMSSQAMRRLKVLCSKHSIPIHLDGARIFNAAEALGVSAKAIAENCDSVMFCVSKGLGAPIGSLLCGSKAFIDQAREWRKMLGGTMRQSGIVAACGIYALENNLKQLAIDRAHTQLLAKQLSDLKMLQIDPAPQSNILLFDLKRADITSQRFCNLLAEKGIRGSCVSVDEARLVFHQGITVEDVFYTAKQILAVDKELLRFVDKHRQ